MSPSPYEPIKKKDLGISAAIDDKSATKKIDDAIHLALHKEATEIHFEPHPEEMLIRMRVNGLMEQVDKVPINIAHLLINRIKVLSSMDITKTKIPQDGYFKYNMEKPIEIYSHIFPSLYGERATLKLQYKREISLNLDSLGFQPTMLENLKKSLSKPNGLILIVGPPGNGKTTTSYAILNHLNAPTKNVITYESVIKYEIPGVLQGKPDEKSEVSYAQGVKSIMDQEPDLVLIGEIQSLDTAKIVVQGAFYKRIVIARVPANNCVNAINYLIDMGVQPFLITSALNAIIAQRLVRKLCDKCKEPFSPSQALLQEIGYKLRPDIKFYKAVGCSECNQSGYSGLTGIFELLMPSEGLNELIMSREPTKKIYEMLLSGGFIPLKKDGIIKAASGITTVEEVLNVL